MSYPIQTITAPTLGEFEELLNKIFPDFTDDEVQIVKNVHIAIVDGEPYFQIKLRRLKKATGVNASELG